MKNIFLDFIAPDFWKTYVTIPNNVEERFNVRDAIKEEVEHSLNIAVLLTKDFCLLPPSFILQSGVVFDVCVSKDFFFEQGIIKMPLKENSIDLFIDKKLREYEFVHEYHKGFYIEDRWNFLYKHRQAIIKRNASMGITIAKKWTNASIDSDIWKPIKVKMPQYVDVLREAPSTLQNRDISVTLEAIMKYLKLPDLDSTKYLVNQAIQYEYGMEYLKEFDACILSDIPPKPFGVNYLLPIESIFYRYSFIKNILTKMRILNYLENADSETIFCLRMESTFLALKEKLFQYCNSISNDVIALIDIYKTIEEIGDLENLQFSSLLSGGDKKNLYKEVVGRFDRVLEVLNSSKNSTLSGSNMDSLKLEAKIMSFTIQNSTIGQVIDLSESKNPKVKNKMVINPVDGPDYDLFKESLIEIRDANAFEEAQKKDINDAISAADKKDESKFIRALKNVALFAKDILSQISADVFVSYMRSNGIIP